MKFFNIKIKSFFAFIFFAIFCFTTVITAYAQDILPTLEAITFKNATVDGEFSSDIQEYGLTLTDNTVSPSLESYAIKGDADIFVTYSYDETNRQTGLVVTLTYDSGSTIYNFTYSNPAEYTISDDNTLSSIICTFGELSPEMNDNDTTYKLYIPSDMTELTITPVTHDVNAYCAPVILTLSEEQTPNITLYCTASNGDKREYTVKIKRVDKTTEEIKYEMSQPDYTSFVDGTLLYQKPEFLIAAGGTIGGIIILILLWRGTKRIAVNPYDSDEKPFYRPDE
ncbi:MAG: hypothetical protein LIO62_03670 [Clostridiales bacterium]|nr:hypothetical protein [Clostridiales bacterium]